MRTQELLERLVSEMNDNCGDILAAARKCGCSLQFIKAWRKDDRIVDEELAEAERMGTRGLVSAAINRAVHGYEEDVYYKGVVVGQQKKYSDMLLTTLLKAKVDEFKPANEGTPQVTVNIANLMPRASSYEEWLSMRDATNAPKDAQALPAPDNSNVIDVDFKAIETEVEPAPVAFKGISL